MDNIGLNTDETKPDLESGRSICRCCLTTDRRMSNASIYEAFFQDLAGVTVSESDGLPQWVCYVCSRLLYKAVRFKHKLLKAHNLLYEYLTRCAPFPIDAQDPELGKYASPNLSPTSTLALDVSGKARLGFHKPIQHEKQITATELDVLDLPLLVVDKTENEEVAFEGGFSDYEDNITLEEYKSSTNKIGNELSEMLQTADENFLLEVKKKKKLKKKEKLKKKKPSDSMVNEPTVKPSIRKAVELDPTKIRMVILNPQDQIKQREEESKAAFKFPFQCNLCFKGFNFESKLQNHMTKHSPSRGPFECKLCHMYLPTAYSYSVHSLIHTRRYECLKCSRRMTDKASILDHYRTQHEGLLTLFTCQLCGKVSSNCKTHRGHMRNNHGGDRPKCEQCGKSFVNKDSLAEHVQIHQGIKNYECATCGKRFRTRTQIKHHQLKHTDVKEFYCVECDTRFKSAHNLRQHLLKSLKHKDKQSLK
ncbi:zinc finger protein 879-like isoform X2 [Galleria mellonella]|nr:zinc finger protein 879-like isoform X2 [Galleria mellonella]